MNDWWKTALAGAGGVGLLAATGGLAAPSLLAAEGTAAAAGTAGAVGTGAAEGGMLAGEVGTGAVSTGAGTTFGGMNAANALGATLTPEGGMLAAPASTGMFVTPPVMGAAGSLDGTLAGTSFGYGSPAALAESGAMNTGPVQGLLTQAKGYAGQAGKAASAYTTVNNAMGGNQPQHQAPPGRPIFQGNAPQIAPGVATAPVQSPVMQSGGNAGGMLRAIAQQRLGKRF